MKSVGTVVVYTGIKFCMSIRDWVFRLGRIYSQLYQVLQDRSKSGILSAAGILLVFGRRI